MKLIDKILGRAPATEAAQVREVMPRQIVNQPALDAASKRIGMWVVVNGAVGILTGARADGGAEVTLAKPDGSTLMTIGPNDTAIPFVVIAPFDQVRQARIHEIPEQRRGDPAKLADFGYQ